MPKIVGFANGCFDILHQGHIHLFKEAKKKCDYLIIGLNSDKSVRKLKGTDRPIFNQKHRKTILENIKYIDKVILFNELTPKNLILKLKPNIIFKGSDYEKKKVVGYKLLPRKGLISIIKLKKNISTTKLIKNLIINISKVSKSKKSKIHKRGN